MAIRATPSFRQGKRRVDGNYVWLGVLGGPKYILVGDDRPRIGRQSIGQHG
jgi:hypothetical protein